MRKVVDPRFPHRSESSEAAGARNARGSQRPPFQPRRRAPGLSGRLHAIKEEWDNLPLGLKILFTAAALTTIGGAAYYMLSSGADNVNPMPVPVGKAKKLSPSDSLALSTPRPPKRTNPRAQNLVDQIDARLTVSPAVTANFSPSKIQEARKRFLDNIYEYVSRNVSTFTCQLENIMGRQPDPSLIYEGGPDRNFTVKIIMQRELGGATVAQFNRHTNEMLIPIDNIHPPSFSSRITLHEVYHGHINADNKITGRKFYTADGKQLTSYSGPYDPDPSIRGRVELGTIHLILHDGFKKAKELSLTLDKYFRQGYTPLSPAEKASLTTYFKIRGLKSPAASITSYDSREALATSYDPEEFSRVHDDEAIILKMTGGKQVAKGSFFEATPANCLGVTIADIVRYACRVRRMLDGSYILDIRSSLDTTQGLLQAPLTDLIIRWTDYLRQPGIDPANQYNEWDAIVQELFAPYPELANFLFPGWADYHRNRSSTGYQRCLANES